MFLAWEVAKTRSTARIIEQKNGNSLQELPYDISDIGI